MNNDRARTIRDIFEACLLENSPEQRDLVLARQCAGDRELEASVRQLLQAQAMGNTFLERPLVSLLDGDVNARDTATKAHDADANADFTMTADPPAIGPYHLREQIGEGGFGLVYVAEQETPVRRKVAIKVIKPGMDTRQIIARFEAERQALAMLDHPHIAKIFDGGTTDQGRPYFAMELVPGVSINQFCDQVSMSLRERIELFLSVCSAVQHAHQKGIIHRDLKPSNVLVTMRDDTPVVKVIDFGVAKAINQKLTEKTIYTAMGQMIGTPIYMSPEQAQMNEADVDTRSDIYSLGVLLYELLTGTTPFELQTFQQMGLDKLRAMICETEPPRPSSRINTLAAHSAKTVADRRKIDLRRLKDDLHGELDWIVMKAMEKNRNRRYETVSGLAADLQRYLNDEPVLARPPSTLYRMQKFARKHTGALVTVALVLLTMLAGILLTSRQALIANREAVRANQAEQDAKLAQSEAEAAATEANNLAALAGQKAKDAQLAAEKEAEQRMLAEQATRRESVQRSRAEQALYLADTRLAANRIEDGLRSSAMELLLQHLPGSDASDRRAWEWYYLIGMANQSRLEWQAHAYDGTEIAWSPDGTRIATAGNDVAMKIWDASTGEEIKRFQLGPTILCGVAWHPHGKEIAWSSASPEGVVRIWNEETDSVETLDADTESIWSLAWDSSGDRLLIGGMQNEGNNKVNNVVLWERSEGPWSIVAQSQQTYNVRSVRWVQDERRISLCQHRGGFRTLDGETLELVAEFPEMPESQTSSWNPESAQLAVGLWSGHCVILDLDSGRELHRFMAHAGSIEHVEWSPQHDRLATCGLDGLVKVWNPADWTLLQSFSGHAGMVSEFSWSPDATRIASIGRDGLVFVWEAASSPAAFSEYKLPTLSHFAWTEDNLIRSVTSPTSITDRDPRSGQIHRTITLPSADNWALFERHVVADPDRNNESHRGEVFLISPEYEIIPTHITLRESFNTTALLSPKRDAVLRIDQFSVANPTLFEVDGRYQRRLGGEDLKSVRQIRWSPEGDRVATVGSGLATDDGNSMYMGWLHLIDPATGNIVRRTRVGSSRLQATAVAWKADSTQIAAASMDGICQVMDGETLNIRLRKKIHHGRVLSLHWHPHDERIASGGEDHALHIWDSSSGEVLVTFPMESPVWQVEWSPDGSMLAAKVGGNICIWDASSGMTLDQSGRFTTRLKNQQWIEQRWIRANAFVLYRQGQYREAADEFRKLIELTPDSAIDQLNLAYALGKNGEHEQADLHFYKAAELAADNASEQNSLGVYLLDQAGRQEEAMKFFQRAIALDPDYAGACTNLATAYATLGRYQEAVGPLKRVLEINPEEPNALSVLALIQVLAKDLEGYRSTCGAMLTAFAESADEELHRRAVWACCLGDNAVEDYSTAIALARAMVEKHPESATHQTTLGAILLRVGQFDEATSVLEKALGGPITVTTSQAYTRYLLAMTEWQRDNREAAKTRLDEANRLATEELSSSPAWTRKETLLLFRRQAEAMQRAYPKTALRLVE